MKNYKDNKKTFILDEYHNELVTTKFEIFPGNTLNAIFSMGKTEKAIFSTGHKSEEMFKFLRAYFGS